MKLHRQVSGIVALVLLLAAACTEATDPPGPPPGPATRLMKAPPIDDACGPRACVDEDPTDCFASVCDPEAGECVAEQRPDDSRCGEGPPYQCRDGRCLNLSVPDAGVGN
jgi:hypothetical protein